MKREGWHKEDARAGCTVRRARDIFKHFQRYPLEQPAESHRYVDQGYQKGNVVITVEHIHET